MGSDWKQKPSINPAIFIPFLFQLIFFLDTYLASVKSTELDWISET